MCWQPPHLYAVSPIAARWNIVLQIENFPFFATMEQYNQLYNICLLFFSDDGLKYRIRVSEQRHFGIY